jgi:hypothetical protein
MKAAEVRYSFGIIDMIRLSPAINTTGQGVELPVPSLGQYSRNHYFKRVLELMRQCKCLVTRLFARNAS